MTCPSDSFQRPINYLRISVTDRCNLRCTYCMPREGVPLMPRSEILSYEEIATVVRAAAEMGISKIRISGGEPLVRDGLVKLIAKIDIPVHDYLKDLSSEMNVDDIRTVLGEKAIFEKNMERNFIDDKEKERVLNGFLDSLLASLVSYLSVPDFPKQFISRKYREAKSQTNWYQE